MPCVGSEIPIYRVDQKGDVESFGVLRILQNDHYAFIPERTGSPQLSAGLPFFLQDLRPQGFLGRLVPQHHHDSKLPDRILDWSDDDVLTYLINRGEDLGGDLLVGRESYLRLLTAREKPARPIDARDRQTRYPALADQVIEGRVVGPYAGGEQPKFLTAVVGATGNVAHVIVKFSPKVGTASGRRWADLLLAEQIAAQTLNDHGIEASQTKIITGGERYFLEVQRFDRIGRHGRAPMVSLAGMDGLLGMLDKPWSTAAGVLADKGWLSPGDLEKIRTVDLFGSLIGNTDRHPGNLSMAWSDQGTFRLLPIYDMLPMMYRPNSQGEIVGREFNPAVIHTLDLRYLPAATRMAFDFWRRVLNDATISDDFKAIDDKHMSALNPLTLAGGMSMPVREPDEEEPEEPIAPAH